MSSPEPADRRDDLAATIAAATAGSALQRMIGRKVGRYVIVSLIGEGGMGAVYLAEQEHPKRQVALELIRAGSASHQLLKRFALEAEALGRLQHPGIAQIHEAGAHDSGDGAQPYFAMEYIRGEPLDVYVRERTLGTRQRLELAAKICDAVQHAHQKGLIHRDLKPGNILVTAEGQPKILDFGVARATDSDIKTTTLQTDIGQLIGTVPYMSPEQVTGNPDELDTRSDVYALGVMIYEMLAGKLPYELERKMIHEAVRVIREQEPTRLSNVDRIFRGDVETIVSKALEKDKTQRYQAASALAADIRRYLADEPIAARPPSTWYQFRKFAKRNKILVTATALVFFALLVGATVATWQAIRATAAETQVIVDRDEARTQAAKAEQMASFVRAMLEGVEPTTARGRDTTLLRIILEQAVARADTELAYQPEVEAAIRYTVGKTFNKIGEFDRASPQLERAEGLQKASVGENNRQYLRIRAEQGNLLAQRGRHAEAETLLRRTLGRQTELLGRDDPDTLDSSYMLGVAVSRQGRQMEAEPLLRDTLERLHKTKGDDDDRTIACEGSLAITIYMQGRYEEAEKLIRSALDSRVRVSGPDHTGTFILQSNLAGVLSAEKKNDEAEKLNLASLEGVKRVFGPEHPETLKQMNNVAAFYFNVGRLKEAEDLHRQTLEIRQRVLGPDHAETLFSIYNMGQVLAAEGRLEEAKVYALQALEGRIRTLGSDHSDTVASLGAMARLESRLRHFQEAAKYMGMSARAERNLLGDADPDLLIAYYNWAATLQNSGDDAGSEKVYLETIDLYNKNGKKDAPVMAAAFNGYAKALLARGDFAAAEPNFKQGLEMRRRLFGDKHRETAYSLNDYADGLVKNGRAVEAEPLLRDALLIHEAAKADDPVGWATAQYSLGACLMKQKRWIDAEPFMLGAQANIAAINGPIDVNDLRRTYLSDLVDFYEQWEAASPGAGKDAEAARWRKALAAFDAAHPTNPTTTQPGG